MEGGPDTRAAGAPRGSVQICQLADLDSLLPLAISQPQSALATATMVIAKDTDAATLSIAHQAAAIVHRDRGRTEEALSHGYAALRLALGASADRQADVIATLGVVLFVAGRTAEALNVSSTRPRPADSSSTDLPRLLLRRAYLALVGRDTRRSRT